jgi:hypothetical protein
MSATELVDYGYIIVCIYRSPDSNFWIFLKNLELLIQIVKSRNKKLLVCGDWNLNFMLDSIMVQEVQNLLKCYDLINMVRYLTRITCSIESLIDVIVINKDTPELRATVVDLGSSDHLAQIIKTNNGKGNRKNETVMRRRFTSNRVEEFKNLLSKLPWNEVFNNSDVNNSLKPFMDIFLECFNIAFPYKRVKSRDVINKRWFSKGLIVSSRRVKVLNSLKGKFTLTREVLDYIKKYQRIYKRVLREAKKETMIGMS